MSKDNRYITIKNLITSGFIIRLVQIVDIIPKTTIARDLGMHHQTFEKLIKDPEKLTFEQVFLISSLIEVDPKVIIDLIYRQYTENRKNKVKK
jgi:hypothetical protein